MYTLWLMPDKEAYQKLSKLIIDLSTLHETPEFEPHVTLLSGIMDEEAQAIQKTAQLANQFSMISANLNRIDFLELFYRCLFFHTNKSQALMEIRSAAEALFEHTNITPFVPHVSFLYGSLPVFQKEAIIAELGEAFFINFNMTRIRLVKTQRTPEFWTLIKEFEL